MTGGCVYVNRLCAWAPGIESSSDWDEWAAGKRAISVGRGPDIAFTEPMFRRRLSRISRMTIQVIHDLMPLAQDTKVFFISFRGELSRQFQINKMLIEEKELSPAAFSLSVFNAPAALASMALSLKGGYSALYPGNNSFAAGLKAAVAALLCGAPKELCLVYADEEVQGEYLGLCRDTQAPAPAAFGLLLSRSPEGSGVLLPAPDEDDSPKDSPLDSPKDSPLDFLRRLLLRGEIHVSP